MGFPTPPPPLPSLLGLQRINEFGTHSFWAKRGLMASNWNIWNTSTFPHRHKNLEVIKGDACDLESFAAAVEGKDAVMSCLGVHVALVFGSTSLYSESAKAITEAMKRSVCWWLDLTASDIWSTSKTCYFGPSPETHKNIYSWPSCLVIEKTIFISKGQIC